MRFTRISVSAFFAILYLAGCAGTPPPGAQASAAHHGKCEHVTGSMLCADNDDALSSNNSPGSSAPAANGTQSQLSGAR